MTGYLVGSLERFNTGKRAEVEDRVSHDTSYSSDYFKTLRGDEEQ